MEQAIVQFFVLVVPAFGVMAFAYTNLVRRMDGRNKLLYKRVEDLEKALDQSETIKRQLQNRLFNAREKNAKLVQEFQNELDTLKSEFSRLEREFNDLKQKYNSEVVLREHVQTTLEKTNALLLEERERRVKAEDELAIARDKIKTLTAQLETQGEQDDP